ncbi:MAG: 50S ribosomal protein L25 [Pyrinomonadaceae bacterium]
MADKVLVKGEIRAARGSNDARRLRAQGKLPVSVYGGGQDTVAAIAKLSELAAILRSDSGVNTVFSMDIDGHGETDVIFHDRQIHPVKGTLMHADLRRIAKGEKIEVTIPLHLVGEPEALNEDGAVLNHNLRELKIVCTPSKIPDSIDVDISGLTGDHAIHVSDIKVEEGVEILEDAETVVASISIVKEEELEPQLEEGAEPAVEGDEAKTPEGESEKSEE